MRLERHTPVQLKSEYPPRSGYLHNGNISGAPAASRLSGFFCIWILLILTTKQIMKRMSFKTANMLFQVLVHSFMAIIYQSFVDFFMGTHNDRFSCGRCNLKHETCKQNTFSLLPRHSSQYQFAQSNKLIKSTKYLSRNICVIYMSCMYHWVFCMRRPIWISMDQCELKWVKLTVKCLAMCSPSRRTSPWWPKVQNEPWATQQLVVVDCGLSDSTSKWTSNMM